MHDILLGELTGTIQPLLDRGIDPKITVPFCIEFLGATMRLFEMDYFKPGIEESAQLADLAIESILNLNQDISRAGFGRVDESLCGQLELELRELLQR